jgi:hypothetical protein
LYELIANCIISRNNFMACRAEGFSCRGFKRGMPHEKHAVAAGNMRTSLEACEI